MGGVAGNSQPGRVKPLVLLFQSSFGKTNRDSFDGVFRYAREVGWTVQTVCFADASASRFTSEPSVSDIRGLLRFWRPDGCIVECAGRAPRMKPSLFGKTPVVFLDCSPSDAGRGAICVSSESGSVAACAAKELLSLGFSDYAYLPHSHNVIWSRERGDEFRRLVLMNGKRFHACPAPLPEGDDMALHNALARWAASLPKPCGVFAVNDSRADKMLRACAAAGISVPDGIAVVGVDDDGQVCENAQPSLSSVHTDNECSGYVASQLLSRCLSAGGRRAARSAVFGASGVHRRASTRLQGCGDVRVRRALEFIRRHVCEGIMVHDVVAEMDCSRRLADLRFRERLGHSILDEIQTVRIEEVKRLLSGPQQRISAIVDICGYASLSVLCREFRKWTGASMREWRRRQRPQ